VTAPEEHHEDPEIGYLDDLRALEPLFQPFSDAELAKRKRMADQPGRYLTHEEVVRGLGELARRLGGWPDEDDPPR
jgi:hypothetical protein